MNRPHSRAEEGVQAAPTSAGGAGLEGVGLCSRTPHRLPRELTSALLIDTSPLPRLGSISPSHKSHARAELACGGSEEVFIASGLMWSPSSGVTVLPMSIVGSENGLSTLLPSKPSDVARDLASSGKVCSSSTGEEASDEVEREKTRAEATWHECSMLICDHQRQRAGQEAGGRRLWGRVGFEAGRSPGAQARGVRVKEERRV